MAKKQAEKSIFKNEDIYAGCTHEQYVALRLDYIKSNLYLNFKAQCATIVANKLELKDLGQIALEADKLAQLLISTKA